ncbi:MAG TPA: signal peptidase I [Syntrophomonadaceae bacterium]|nr:signal peptidase I [Syntrophomonadaceae bacterium]
MARKNSEANHCSCGQTCEESSNLVVSNHSQRPRPLNGSKLPFFQSIPGKILALIVLINVVGLLVGFDGKLPFEGRIILSGSMLPTLQIQDRVLINLAAYCFSEPERGDIIIFKIPQRDDIFIKRIIGLPGETVEIKNGKTYINDRPLKEPYLTELMDYKYGPVAIPPNSLFVLGDNRNNSFDSHLWSEWLTQDKVLGKAISIYAPSSHLKILEQEVSFEE